jgi:hypothetical protein
MSYAVWGPLGHHHDELRGRPAPFFRWWAPLLTIALLILMMGLGYLFRGVP